MSDDLLLIQKDYIETAKQCAAASSSSSSSTSIAIDDQKRIPLVRIENGVLIVEDVRFRVGDRVELLSDYAG